MPSKTQRGKTHTGFAKTLETCNLQEGHKTHFSVTGFYGLFTGEDGLFTGILWVFKKWVFAEKWVVPERLWVFMGRFQGFMGRFWVFEMQPAFRTLKTDYILFGDQLPLK